MFDFQSFCNLYVHNIWKNKGIFYNMLYAHRKYIIQFNYFVIDK